MDWKAAAAAGYGTHLGMLSGTSGSQWAELAIKLGGHAPI
jgi:hypothetical protein